MDKEAIRKEIIQTASRRYATKKYNPDKHISDENWRTILEVGRLSPSSNGMEPWKFVLITSDQIKKDITPFSPGALNSIHGADKLLMILVRTDITYDSDYVKHIVQDVKHHAYSQDMPWLQHFKEFLDTDMDIHDKRTCFDWTSKQAYMAAANMMTAAAALDIDTCPIEGFNHQKMTEYLKSHHLTDTEHWEPSLMVSFGYRDQPITPKKRQSMDEIYEEWK